MPEELNSEAAPAAAESTPAPAPETPASPPSETPAAEAPDPLRETFDKVWTKNNPPRDTGRFAPRGPAAPDLPEPQDSIDQPPKAEGEPAAPAIVPPNSWSAADKALWAKAPPDVQAIIARREAEAHRQITSMGEQIRSHEPVRAVYEQHADYLRQIGRTPEEAARQTFAVSQMLDRDPATAIGWLANAYRVDLQQLASGQQQPGNAPSRDVQLEARVRRMESEARARQEAERVNQERAVVSTIDRFAEAKDHPFFEDLQDEILAQIPGIRQHAPHLSHEQMLAEAYEKAKWAHPTVRARVLQDQRKADEDKRRAEAELEVKEAKRLQPLNQRTSKGAMPVKGSMDDTLRRNLDRVMRG